MAMHIVMTLGAITVASLLFSIPLIVKYHIYKPEHKRVTVGDAVTVSGKISSVWCQAVDISSSSHFQAFLYDSEPEVKEDLVVKSVNSHQILLPNKAQEYWGFHLLRGSKVNIATCARLSSGAVTVIKGFHGLRRCLKEHKHRRENGDDSGEESQSESESDDVTSSISSSQGAVMNETEDLFRCKNAIQHVQLPVSYKCNSKQHAFHRKYTLLHEVEETDYYYYVFSSDTYLDILPNLFSVEFTINRTHYDHTSSSSNCSSSDECRLAISIGSKSKIVVQTEVSNGTLKAESLTVACKPRESLFCIFYAGFLVVIFLCAFQ